MSEKFLVESNVRSYMLACSKANRAGKFTRVSKEALEETCVAVDAIIRQIESKIPDPLHPGPMGFGSDEVRLLTGLALEKCRDRLEAAVRKVIRNKVQHTPSCGQTI